MQTKEFWINFLQFTGLVRIGNTFKDLWFYIAILLGPIFYFCLSLFIAPHITLKNPIIFLSSQFFLVSFPEEFFFRGFLIPYLRLEFKLNYSLLGISLANIIAAIFFALLHLFFHPFYWAISTFFPAIIFGYFREKHDSLWPALLLHFIYNTGYFILFGK